MTLLQKSFLHTRGPSWSYSPKLKVNSSATNRWCWTWPDFICRILWKWLLNLSSTPNVPMLWDDWGDSLPQTIQMYNTDRYRCRYYKAFWTKCAPHWGALKPISIIIINPLLQRGHYHYGLILYFPLRLFFKYFF